MSKNWNRTEALSSKLMEYEWGSMEWRLDDSLNSNSGMSVAIMTLKKGHTSPTHRHSNSNEFTFLKQGTIDITLGDELVRLKEGDSIFIPVGTDHGVRNPGDVDALLVVSYSAGSRAYQEVK